MIEFLRSLNAHDLWPYYQLFVGTGTVIIAIEGAMIVRALNRIARKPSLPGGIIKYPSGNLRDEIRLPVNDTGVSFHDPK